MESKLGESENGAVKVPIIIFTGKSWALYVKRTVFCLVRIQPVISIPLVYGFSTTYIQNLKSNSESVNEGIIDNNF